MDALCFDDLDEFGRELDDPFEELVQDVIHILFEVYGSNPDDLTRGVGFGAALSGQANRLPYLQAQTESQLRDDPRISSASCTITKTDNRGEYRVDLVLEVNGVELALAFTVDAAGGIRRAS